MDVLFAVTWIMGRQAWHMYPSCSVHWVMQAEMQHIYRVFLLSQSLPPPLNPLHPLTAPLWSQQVSPWTRTAWFTLSTAPRSGRWTRTASSPLSWVPTTSRRLALWPATTAWTSIRWLTHRTARRLLVQTHTPSRGMSKHPVLFAHTWLIISVV